MAVSDFVVAVKLSFRRFDLALAHKWSIARGLGSDGSGGATTFAVALVELRDRDGVGGLGEAAPSIRYEENVDSALAFLKQIDADQLSFEDIGGSMKYLDGITAGHFAS